MGLLDQPLKSQQRLYYDRNTKYFASQVTATYTFEEKKKTNIKPSLFLD